MLHRKPSSSEFEPAHKQQPEKSRELSPAQRMIELKKIDSAKLITGSQEHADGLVVSPDRAQENPLLTYFPELRWTTPSYCMVSSNGQSLHLLFPVGSVGSVVVTLQRDQDLLQPHSQSVEARAGETLGASGRAGIQQGALEYKKMTYTTKTGAVGVFTAEETAEFHSSYGRLLPVPKKLAVTFPNFLTQYTVRNKSSLHQSTVQVVLDHFPMHTNGTLTGLEWVQSVTKCTELLQPTTTRVTGRPVIWEQQLGGNSTLARAISLPLLRWMARRTK